MRFESESFPPRLRFSFFLEKGKQTKKQRTTQPGAQTQENASVRFSNDFADCWSDEHERIGVGAKIGKCLVGVRDTKKGKKETNA